jgi:hypothetical protein
MNSEAQDAHGGAVLASACTEIMGGPPILTSKESARDRACGGRAMTSKKGADDTERGGL